MMERISRRGRDTARQLSRSRVRVQLAQLEERVEMLDQEIQECRQLNLRLAELTDVVQELLLPVAQRDEAKVAEVMERYSKGL